MCYYTLTLTDEVNEMPKVRTGKTAKDRVMGAFAKNAANKAERANWRNQSTGSRLNTNFPRHTCNGKRNRFFDKHGDARS
jgi:hypothetical protein